MSKIISWGSLGLGLGILVNASIAAGAKRMSDSFAAGFSAAALFGVILLGISLVVCGFILSALRAEEKRASFVLSYIVGVGSIGLGFAWPEPSQTFLLNISQCVGIFFIGLSGAIPASLWLLRSVTSYGEETSGRKLLGWILWGAGLMIFALSLINIADYLGGLLWGYALLMPIFAGFAIGTMSLLTQEATEQETIIKTFFLAVGIIGGTSLTLLLNRLELAIWQVGLLLLGGDCLIRIGALLMWWNEVFVELPWLLFPPHLRYGRFPFAHLLWGSREAN